MTSPLVSVVIPIYLRPTLVLRAIGSALAQTVKDIEVIVMVDGRDDESRRALATIEDCRLAVMVPYQHLG
jgi:glycosyltransferase involved in cell wall biosynthesis